MSDSRKALLAMSGGVDSSTAAILLLRQGYEIVGCTMQLWDYTRNSGPGGTPQPGRCCSLDDVYDARRVAEKLGFRFYVLNLEREFERRVIAPFIGEYLRGRTPIPCTGCNTFLKFDRLITFADQIGLSKVATGHYAQVRHEPGVGYQLLKGRDLRKDQSYYLFRLSQSQLSRIVFPVGEHKKEEIRQVAGDYGLMTAEKAESQEICFVPDGDYAGFIQRYTSEVAPALVPLLEERDKPGPIVFIDGTPLGTHRGLFRYTIGQRKGLGIAHSRPLYVKELDVANNTLVAGHREHVLASEFRVEDINWISGECPSRAFRAGVKIRANHQEAPALIRPVERFSNSAGGGTAEVVFEDPQLAVTPGQAAVFYAGQQVLGGGWICGRK